MWFFPCMIIHLLINIDVNLHKSLLQLFLIFLLLLSFNYRITVIILYLLILLLFLLLLLHYNYHQLIQCKILYVAMQLYLLIEILLEYTCHLSFISRVSYKLHLLPIYNHNHKHNHIQFKHQAHLLNNLNQLLWLLHHHLVHSPFILLSIERPIHESSQIPLQRPQPFIQPPPEPVLRPLALPNPQFIQVSSRLASLPRYIVKIGLIGVNMGKILSKYKIPGILYELFFNR